MENKKKGWGCWFSSLFLSRAFVFLFPFFSTRVRILGLENYVGDFLKLDRGNEAFPSFALPGFDLTRFRVLFISFAGDFWSSCFLVLCSSTGSREAQRWWCLALWGAHAGKWAGGPSFARVRAAAAGVLSTLVQGRPAPNPGKLRPAAAAALSAGKAAPCSRPVRRSPSSSGLQQQLRLLPAEGGGRQLVLRRAGSASRRAARGREASGGQQGQGSC